MESRFFDEPQEPPLGGDECAFRRLAQEGDQGVPRPDGFEWPAGERRALDPARPDGAKVPCGLIDARRGLDDVRRARQVPAPCGRLIPCGGAHGCEDAGHRRRCEALHRDAVAEARRRTRRRQYGRAWRRGRSGGRRSSCRR